jgi:hypothetical protein
MDCTNFTKFIADSDNSRINREEPEGQPDEEENQESENNGSEGGDAESSD